MRPLSTSCEGTHGNARHVALQYLPGFYGSKPISKEQAFSDCIVLDKDAFDPDAVFLEDIVDDEVLPRLSLAVDGLTSSGDRSSGSLRLDGAANEPIPTSTNMPVATLDPDQLEVYGWETSLWRKIRGYLGF